MNKVLHISSDSNFGGAGQQILSLIAASKGYLHEVVVPEGSQLISRLQAQGIKYYEAPHIAEKSFSHDGTHALGDLIKKIKPDIVHTHGCMSGRVAARFSGCKVLHTRHSVFGVKGWRRWFPFKQLFGCVNNFLSHRVIAVSPAARENLLDMGIKNKKIRVVMNGTKPVKELTLEEVSAFKQRHGIPQGLILIAIPARLTEVKGHDDILDAAKMLPKNAMILIAGKGERQTHLEERIANEDIHNVKLLGFINDVDELIAAMDIQINASFGTEATSMSLIQGMSAGKPAVVTNYGGNPYVIKHEQNGLVVPTRSPQALATALNRMINNPDLYQHISKNAKVIYAKSFTDTIMAAKTEKVYAELCV